MNILDDFIRDNRRIEILSNGGNPLQIPKSWGKVLGDSDILVAIPDMHMHRHDSQLDNFSEGAAPMFEFLMHLEILKHRLVCVGKNLEVIQIGDYYAQSTQPSAVNEIHSSHWIYGEIARQFQNLSVVRLLGDADFELRHSSDSRYTLKTGNVYLEHGFIADYFMPNWTLNHIRETAISELLHKEATGEEYSCTREGDDPSTRTVEYVCRLLDQPENHGVRICIVGHTHKPCLHTDLSQAEQILIDAGAWTDGRSDFAVITNEEVAICSYGW